MKELRDLKDLTIQVRYTMYNLQATNKLQDGGTHFSTLLTITSSSSSNSVSRTRFLGHSEVRRGVTRLIVTSACQSQARWGCRHQLGRLGRIEEHRGVTRPRDGGG